MGGRVIIVDDNEAMRVCVRFLLTGLDGVVIVAEAANGQVAVDLARQQQPDLIVMDVQMPILDGLNATRLIREVAPQARVLVLTAEQRPTIVEEAREVGAAGLVGKSSCMTSLREAVCALLEGRSYFARPLRCSEGYSQL